MDAALTWALAQPAGTAARALADAVVSGVLSVTDREGRSVRYHSAAELRAALVELWRSQAVSTPSRRPAVTIARVGGD